MIVFLQLINFVDGWLVHGSIRGGEGGGGEGRKRGMGRRVVDIAPVMNKMCNSICLLTPVWSISHPRAGCARQRWCSTCENKTAHFSQVYESGKFFGLLCTNVSVHVVNTKVKFLNETAFLLQGQSVSIQQIFWVGHTSVGQIHLTFLPNIPQSSMWSNQDFCKIICPHWVLFHRKCPQNYFFVILQVCCSTTNKNIIFIQKKVK